MTACAEFRRCVAPTDCGEHAGPTVILKNAVRSASEEQRFNFESFLSFHMNQWRPTRQFLVEDLTSLCLLRSQGLPQSVFCLLIPSIDANMVSACLLVIISS
jgi:hypothetical protein